MHLLFHIFAALHEREFWDAYFFGDWFDKDKIDKERSVQGKEHTKRVEPPKEWEEPCELGPFGFNIEVRFARESYGLSLKFNELLSYISLDLSYSGSRSSPEYDASLEKPVEIAWDDQAHWHPHLLRWQELELICRCAALRNENPTFQHPGTPLLLLQRFAPLCDDTAIDVMLPTQEAAWRALNLFSEAEIARYIQRFDRRDNGFVWQKDEDGHWVLDQPGDRSGVGLYSLRHAGSKFPFEAFDKFIAQEKGFYRSSVNPEWFEANDGSVKKLARSIAEDGDFARLPQLADALTDALKAAEAARTSWKTELYPPGLRTIIKRCRKTTDPAEACWIIEWLLQLKVGSLGRRYAQ